MIVQPIQWKGIMATTMNHKSFPQQTPLITIPTLHWWLALGGILILAKCANSRSSS